VGSTPYYVYVLASRIGGTIYIGVTNDLIRRVFEHKSKLAEGFTQKMRTFLRQLRDEGVAVFLTVQLAQTLEQGITLAAGRLAAGGGAMVGDPLPDFAFHQALDPQGPLDEDILLWVAHAAAQGPEVGEALLRRAQDRTLRPVGCHTGELRNLDYVGRIQALGDLRYPDRESEQVGVDLVRGRLGLALTAVRDDEVAARSSGVRVGMVRMLVFVVAAVGCGAAGALNAVSLLGVQPDADFSVQWTAKMAFAVIIGGLGTIEGPILGTLVYMVLQQALQSYNAWYLIVLGLVAIVIALFARRGLWGLVDDHLHIRLFPVGYWVREGRRRRSGGQPSALATESVTWR